MQTTPFRYVSHGDLPIIVLTPHTGGAVPTKLLLQCPAWVPVHGRVSDPAGSRLQVVAQDHGVTCLAAEYHPCVIDLNVGVDGGGLPKRLFQTVLCRTHTSRGEALYPSDCEPREEEVERRVQTIWQPYHAAVDAEISRLRRIHENVLLLVAHASAWLSPYRDTAGAYDCNLGTDGGRSCDRLLVSAITESVRDHGHSWVVNGSGANVFTASRYGVPEMGVHAIEIEISGKWRANMDVRDVEEQEGDAALEGTITNLLALLRSLPRPHVSREPDGLLRQKIDSMRER